MRYFFLSLFFILCLFSYSAQRDGRDENVVISSHITSYVLKSSSYGVLGTVKEKDDIIFEAQRVDGKALALTFYNDGVTIDKASASGAKPQYKKATDKDVLFDDSKVCYIEVPVKAGKESKATFELTHNEPAQFGEITFPCIYFTREYIVEIEVPVDLKSYISIEPVNMPADMLHETFETKDEGVLHRFTLRNLPEVKRERLAPSRTLTSPRLIVKGAFYDLDALYKYLHSYCPQEESPDSAVTAEAMRIAGNVEDKIAAIDSVASWVRRNVRYVAIEHGDYGRRPAASSDVLEKRYGDCKGSANLIKDMLRILGVDCRLTWIGTANYKRRSWAEYPLMSTGNHMIATAILQDTVIFIDGTTGLQPRGFLHPSIQGQEAMIEDGESCVLMRTPVLSASSSTDSACIVYDLTPEGGLVGHASRELSGVFCSSLENTYNSLTASGRDEALQNFLSSRTTSVAFCGVRRERESLDAPTSLLAYTITDYKGVKETNAATYVSVPALHDLPVEPLSDNEMKERTQGVLLPFGWRICTKTIFNLPENAREITIPDNAEIESQWFKAKFSYRLLEDNRMECLAEVETLRLEAMPEEVPEWNDSLNKIIKTSSKKIKINKI